MGKRMKNSLRKQFAVITIGLVAITVFACWFINSTFLITYYEMDKKESVYNAFEMLNKATTNGQLESQDFIDEMQKYTNRYNINMIVIDADSQTVLTTAFRSEDLKMTLLGYIFEDASELNIDVNREALVPFKTMDRRTNTECIEMYGAMDNGYWVLLRTPMESIQESVSISNRFLTYIGFFATVISGIVIWIVSKKFTKPVLELANISEKMAHLDFEAKYNGHANNEIGLLGANINTLSESLEKTISELKTANNKLKNDIEIMEKVDEMRKEFLSNVSHELKTPIALIQGYAEGLKEGISDDEESRDYYCEVIMDEARKMNIMVKKLLTLNQLEFGTDVVTMERFDITALIKNYIQSAQILTNANDIKVEMCEQEPIFVWADEFRTEEVFMNYFSNAINHCAGEKIIDVKLEELEGKVRISVFNTGEPIPEDSIDRLWEKFYKVDKARTREYGGSGIGLSIVKAIVNSMGQECGVMNYTNGVLFWFELETSASEL